MDEIILLTLIIIFSALFVALFTYAAITVGKLRKQVQLRIIRASVAAQKINQDEKGYFCRYTPLSTIVDANENEISISDDEDYKIIFRGLTPDSRVPSKAYALCIEGACFEHGLSGETLNTLLFFVCPKNILCRWAILSIKENGILCTHPIMGEIYVHLDEQQLSILHIGMSVMIKQCAEQIEGNYRISYTYSGL